MMRKKITFFALSTTATSAKRISFTHSFLYFMAFFIVLTAGAVGYMVYDYSHLRRVRYRSHMMAERIANQQDVIDRQNQQLQTFAQEINELKSGLLSLSQFEEKIRIIANLESDSPDDGLFGVGGSIPDDLNPRIGMERSAGRLIRKMHENVDQLDAACDVQTDRFENLLDALKEQRNLLACTPAIRPVEGWKTSAFGYRTSPFTGIREFHKGLDIANRKGTPIVATADAVVADVARKGLLGKVVILDHGYGIITRYAHIDKAMVKRGDKVQRGATIATVGNSGRTTGSHLHYEVIVDGVPVNPEKYILD